MSVESYNFYLRVPHILRLQQILLQEFNEVGWLELLLLFVVRLLHSLSIIPDSIQVKIAVMKARIPNPIAAIIKIAVDSVNTNAIIRNVINTIAEISNGLSINFCKAAENNITASGITIK